MEDAKIRKPLIDALFRGRSYKISVFVCFKCEITTIIAGNFEKNPSVSLTKKNRFSIE